jgi:hypothetical protein
LSDTGYEAGICPQAEQILQTAIVIRIHEFFTDQDIEDTIAGIRKVAAHFTNHSATRG